MIPDFIDYREYRSGLMLWNRRRRRLPWRQDEPNESFHEDNRRYTMPVTPGRRGLAVDPLGARRTSHDARRSAIAGAAMNVKNLLTLSFDKNVGARDRVFRLASGAAAASAGWLVHAPLGTAIGLSIAGAVWMATGVLSRCSIYYLLGYSTRPRAQMRST